MNGTDDAIDALRLGEYQRAEQLLAALGATKGHVGPRLRLLWALTQLMRRNMNECVDVMHGVCARSAKDGETVYMQLRRLVGPVETVFSPDAAQEIRLRLGDYFLRQQKPDEAMQWLHYARAAAPDDPLAIYLEANCRFELYRERRALQEMESVLERAATDKKRAYFVGGRTAAFWFRLGAAHERLGNLERAAGYLGDAIELSDSTEWTAYNSTARLLLGDVLIRLERFEDALAELEAIPRDAHNYRYAIRLRAVALFRTGDTDTALALLREAAELDPLGALIFLEEGRIHLATDNLDDAEMALARAFRTDPDLPGLKSAIIALELRLGQPMDPDAGLPAPDAFDIPEEFTLRADDPSINRRSKLRDGLASLINVIRTIMVRDMLNKHGQSGMGYAGMVVEPLVWIATIDLAWRLKGEGSKHGIPVESFLISGLAAYFLFYAHVLGTVSSAVTSNTNLLYFRRVTPLALIVASGLREFLTAIIVYAVIIGGLSLYQNDLQLADPLKLLVVLGAISTLAAIGGVLFGLGQLVVPWLRVVQLVYVRMMFIFSGGFFFANDLPPQVAYYASFNPLMDLIEFLREAFYVQYQSRYATWEYPFAFIAVGIALVLVLERTTRRYLATA